MTRELRPAGAPGTGLDTVELHGLRARGRHGVLAAETELGQDFVVDLALHVDTSAAGRSDDLTDAVDYGEVARGVHGVVTGEPVHLLEALAARIADLVLADVRVRAVDVAVHKPAAPVPVPFGDVVVRVHRRNGAARAVLALGANLGDPARALVSAVAALDASDGVAVTASSPVHRTTAVLAPGAPAQPDYLNAVVAVTTTLRPRALLAACQAVEVAHGRDRSGEEERWGPRTLDIDVLTLDGAVLDEPTTTTGPPLVLPHPRAHERAFVLVPWAAMAPGDVLPGHGRVADLAAALLATGGGAGVVEVPDPVLWPAAPRRPTASAASSAPPGERR